MLSLYQVERFCRGHWECPAIDCSDKAVILASYPKSGNTWARFVVSNIAAIFKGKASADFNSIRYFAPEIRGNRQLNGAFFDDKLPLFLKSHFAYVPGFSSYKSVVIIRDPFKVIPSYREYLMKAREKPMPDIMTFCKHWRYGLNAWACFAASWENHATIIVKYEDLQNDPELGFKKIYSDLGFDIEIDIIRKALELSSRKNMKKTLESKGDPYNKNNFSFVRGKNENQGIRSLINDAQLESEFPFFIEQAKKYGYF